MARLVTLTVSREGYTDKAVFHFSQYHRAYDAGSKLRDAGFTVEGLGLPATSLDMPPSAVVESALMAIRR